MFVSFIKLHRIGKFTNRNRRFLHTNCNNSIATFKVSPLLLHNQTICQYTERLVSTVPPIDYPNHKMATADESPGIFENRLAREKSPYLLQHAHNPVDWYPWGDEAIDKAKRERKLIFLSVGYSTCHWCHVMEKESFENHDVAKVMNEHFVNIKVDREERPDIDHIYMSFVLMLNGSGGWPMSVWLTPDLAPITAGTYFPPEDKWNVPGFKSILLRIAHLWQDKSADLLASGKEIIKSMEKDAKERKPSVDDVSTVADKFNQSTIIYKRNFDDVWGGYHKSAPKFPEVAKLNLIAHTTVIDPTTELLPSLIHTLKCMFNGGIHDHVFGGFARYSVDRKWHVPHFEKMLYDQAQLMAIYSYVYRLTGIELFLDVADRIFQYVEQDLRHPLGGYYSGEDADSLRSHIESVKYEGAFYAWSYDQLKEIILPNKFDIPSDEAFKLFCTYYGVEKDGNILPSSDPHGHLLGQNILMISKEIGDLTDGTDESVIRNVLNECRQLLYVEREKRPRPHLDTKIICSWNGLMLSGLSKLGSIQSGPNQQKYKEAADKLVQFIEQNLWNAETKTLLRACYGDGTKSEEMLERSTPINGFLDDYAFLIRGLIDYYLLTMDIDRLRWAKQLQDIQNELFWDGEQGGYFNTQENAPGVILRLKDEHDGAEPCGNSVAAANLLQLSAYFKETDYKSMVRKLFDYFSTTNVLGYTLPEMMSSLLLKEQGLTMLVIVGPSTKESEQLLDVVRSYYVPGLVLVHYDPSKPERKTRKSVEGFKMVGNVATAYLCHNKVCQLPVTTTDGLHEIFKSKYEVRV